MATKTIHKDEYKIVIEEGQILAPQQIDEADVMVQMARSKLQTAEILVRTAYMKPTVARYLKTFFNLTGSVKDAGFVQGVLTVTDNINTLIGAVNSKDLELQPLVVTDETADAAAFVRRGAVGYLMEKVRLPDPNKPATDFYGPLNLRFDRLFPVGTAAANLIHEASHRYIGTRDWAYLPNYDLVTWENDMTQAGIALSAPKSINAIKSWYEMSTAEALNNADSYGGFCMHVTD